jgi:serine/threonine protein kinase
VRRGTRLGSGAFGAVYSCRVEGVPGLVACKSLQFDEDCSENVERELAVMKAIPRHDSIVALIGASRVSNDRGARLIIMERLDMSLQKLLVQRRAEVADELDDWLGTSTIACITRGVLLGVHHLHVTAGIVHRDLKVWLVFRRHGVTDRFVFVNHLMQPDNVLLEMAPGNRPIRACLADFGTSAGGETSSLQTQVGTVSYMAPEILQGPYDAKACDIFRWGAFSSRSFRASRFMRQSYQVRAPEVHRSFHRIKWNMFWTTPAWTPMRLAQSSCVL